MSQQQLPQELETETNATFKNRKRQNRRKLTKSNESKEFSEAAGDSTVIAEKKPLSTSMEQLQVSLTPPPSTVSRKAAGSNWEAVAKPNHLQKQLASKHDNVAAKGEENCSENAALSKSARRRQKLRAAEKKYIAIDCEMVGVGVNGQDDMLARVSIVSKRGEVLIDKYVKPQEPVIDYRTSVSGIRPRDVINGEDFKSVQKEVEQLLQGKILIGHGISNDLAVLRIKHPYNSIRDTSRYKPLCRLVSYGRTPSLKRLTQAILGKEIQTGEHNSVEDARAAMSIYRKISSDWEAYIRKKQQTSGK